MPVNKYGPILDDICHLYLLGNCSYEELLEKIAFYITKHCDTVRQTKQALEAYLETVSEKKAKK